MVRYIVLFCSYIFTNMHLAMATTKKRYSDTAIHGAGAGAGATHKLCKLLLLITAGDISNIFRGGAQIPKNISY